MPDTELPVQLVYWLAALIPIVLLLVLLVWLRWSTSAAAPLALGVVVAIALFLFRTPLETLAVAAGKGIWDAIFVLYVIWPALILYNTVNDAGGFEIIQRGVRKLMPDRLLVVLTFSWVLSSFIQGIAGFGTPLAVTTPLLIGLGVKPVYAVLLPLLGRAWGSMFGSLGTTWLATLSVVNLPDPGTTLYYTAALLWVPNLMAGLAIAWFYGGWWALKRGAPAIMLISLLHGGLELLLVPLVPTIGNFLATAAALGATLALSRWSFYRQEDEDEPDRIFVKEGERQKKQKQKAGKKGGARKGKEKVAAEPLKSLWYAFLPYIVLAGLAIVALMISPVRSLLEQVQVGLPFPQTSTGYGVAREAVSSYSAFAPLTHPGTLLLISAVFAFFLYKARDMYPARVSGKGIIVRAAQDALPATTAITALLLISKVMDHSGQITVLALGIAEVSPTLVYVAASNLIGILGALITSSNTASNLLFGPLQATIAEVEGIPVALAIAAQSAGGAVGNAFSPNDALVGATVAGIPDELGEILRRALPWTVITGLLLSAFTLALYWLA